MKAVLKTMLRVYSIFCMCLVTILLIAGIVVWANLGRITASVMERVVNKYNAELNMVISNYLRDSVPDNSIQFISINTVTGGGLHAAFRVNSDVVNDVDISSYQNKSNEEIIAELGITAKDMPGEIISVLSMAKQMLIIDIVDKNGDAVINRKITSEEIQRYLKTN